MRRLLALPRSLGSLAIAAITFVTSASAQDIFAALPASIPFHGGIVIQIQQDYAIRSACGPDMPFGCITMLDQRTCVVHLWVGLPADLRTTAETNLRRACGAVP